MVRYHARVLGTLIFLLLLSSVHGVWAGAPTDQLRDGVDRVFKILRDPAMAGDTNTTQRRSAILTAAGTIFDFGEMAKRSLGQHWAARMSSLVRDPYIDTRISEFSWIKREHAPPLNDIGWRVDVKRRRHISR